MCGIFGAWHTDNTPIDLFQVQRATTRLRHRGPDDEGYLLFNTRTRHTALRGGPNTAPGLALPLIDSSYGEAYDVVFGFRRLSILDLTIAGHQPMGSSEGRFQIVFNGEIYNYLELRAELAGYGYAFHTGTDTEVILAAYQHWGTGCLLRFCGMWAFALWDQEKESLLLARDCFGIKPLYYTRLEHGYAFASEIKALLELGDVRRRVNPQRLYDYLRFGLTDFGQETLFADIYQLPPAHYLEIPLGRPVELQPVRYWQVDLGCRLELSFAEAAARLRDLFLDNVQLHLRSDVPVGTALSGGIDSSAIVMAMRYLQGQSLELHTFSYIADEPALDEERWADLVGQAAGAVMHKTRPDGQNLVDDLDHLVAVQDEPFGSTSIYAQHRIFALAHTEGVKVMLNGQGADELLGGYRSYLSARLASLLRQGRWLAAVRFLQQAVRLPQTGALRLLLGAGGLLLPVQLQGPAMRLIGEDLVPRWLNAAWFSTHGAIPRSLRQGRGRELLRDQLYQSLVDRSLVMLLRYEDRNSMAYSIESRVPFLTPALVNFVLSLPEEYLIAPDGTSKAVFRQAMRGIVPDEILNRRNKIGFETPEQRWLEGLRPWVEGVLHSETAAQIPALNVAAVKEEWQAVLQRQKRFDFRVWRWVNLIRWTERFEVSFD